MFKKQFFKVISYFIPSLLVGTGIVFFTIGFSDIFSFSSHMATLSVIDLLLNVVLYIAFGALLVTSGILSFLQLLGKNIKGKELLLSLVPVSFFGIQLLLGFFDMMAAGVWSSPASWMMILFSMVGLTLSVFMLIKKDTNQNVYFIASSFGLAMIYLLVLGFLSMGLVSVSCNMFLLYFICKGLTYFDKKD